MAILSKEQREYLLPEAYNAAVRAGAAILEVYNGTQADSVEMKDDRTPVTEADRRAHEVIKAHLGPTRIPLLSEEGRETLYAERCGWDLLWMVDPLDGTKEFLRRNGEFTVNIALIYDGQPVIGVIYVPCIGRIYFADRQAGVFRQDGVAADHGAAFTLARIMSGAAALPLTVRRNDPIRIAMSRSHNTPETHAHIADLRKHHPQAEVIQQGSSYKFCLLAEGTVDYYARMTPTYEWDTAAGELILEMAGGRTHSMEDGDRLAYNKESLVNPRFACHSKFMELPGN